MWRRAFERHAAFFVLATASRTPAHMVLTIASPVPRVSWRYWRIRRGTGGTYRRIGEIGADGFRHGAPRSAPPASGFSPSIEASLARSTADNASSAAAMPARGSAFGVSPSLVQALVQASGGLSASPLSASLALHRSLVRDQEAEGSNPFTPTFEPVDITCQRVFFIASITTYRNRTGRSE
jgi:hypothetical protein